MKQILPVLFMLISSLCATSQAMARRLNVWALSDSTGVDFNNGAPAAIKTSLNTQEGVASVCDHNGELLFYTDGSSLWDRTHRLMNNGVNLTGLVPPGSSAFSSVTYSTTQSSLIVPMPDSADKYYVFSLSSSERLMDPYRGQLYYCIVDMSLNGGLGDVVAGRKSIYLDSGLAEGLSGVQGDKCNIWVMTRSFKDFRFKAYEISSSGLNSSPVISGFQAPNPDVYWSGGEMAFSNNRQRLAIVKSLILDTGLLDFRAYIELYDFDPANGIVSGQIVIDTVGTQFYGICFSPDDSKLYYSSINSIFQVNLSLGNIAAIKASKFFVGYADGLTAIKKAIDSKLYFRVDVMNLGAVEHPDLAGAACQYNPFAIQLLSGASAFGSFGIPNVVPELITGNVSKHVVMDMCAGTTALLSIAQEKIYDIIWGDGAKDTQRLISTPGIYTVSYRTHPCVYHNDTFDIRMVGTTINLGADTTVCAESFRLAGSGSSASHQWQDGTTDSFFIAEASGRYWVRVSLDGCIASDTIEIALKDLKQDIAEDMVLCVGESMILQANVPGDAQVLWSNGNMTPTIEIKEGGRYWLTVTDMPCQTSDTFIVTERLCNCPVSIPSVFSPNNDGKNDLFRPILLEGCSIKGQEMRIYNRWGQMVYSSSGFVENGGWDGTFKGMPSDAGVYMYILQLEAGLNNSKQVFNGELTLVR